MALQHTHTNWNRGSYTADRNYQIKQAENSSLAIGNLTNLNAHLDRVSLAFGYGYDLLQNVATLTSDLASY